MREPPLPITAHGRLDVVVRIIDRVAGTAVADFQVDHIGRGAIDQMVRIAATSPETAAPASPNSGYFPGAG